MKPNREEGGPTFLAAATYSGHCVTISALPAPPHFSCQEGQQKAGLGGMDGQKKLLTDCFTHWLTRALVSEGRLKSLSAYNKSLSVFQFGKTFSSSNWKNLSFYHVGVFLDFWGEKVHGSGFPCVVGWATLGWYQHNGVLVAQQKRVALISGQLWNRIEENRIE